MELIKISESKLKVTLSADDMAHYDLSCETIDYENTETRRAFWDILDIAKHRTGFDAARDKVYIQVYPCRTGGCELYVTKLQNEACSEGLLTDEPPEQEIPVVLYRTQTFASLASLCARLSDAGYTAESAAYTLEDNCYLALVLHDGEKERYPFLAEFAARERGIFIAAYIREHARAICQADAVHTLARLA